MYLVLISTLRVKKKYKILLYSFVGLFLLLGAILLANKIVKQKIKAGIEKELINSHVEYKDVSIDIVMGSAFVSQPKLKLGSAVISANELRVIDLDYKEYFSNNKIVFDRIIFKEPEILIIQSDTVEKPKNQDSNKKFKDDIKIKHLVIEDGSLRIAKNHRPNNGLFISLKNMNIYDLHITEKSIKNKIPFGYREISINSDSLYYSLNPEHELLVKKMRFKKGVLNISDLKIIPKYSKVEFDKRQKVEADRFDLQIDHILMRKFSWDFAGDKLELQSEKTKIENAEFHVYRNKLLPDDTSFKPLYSQKLRDLETKLKFDKINIINSSIFYEERSLAGNPPGKINFSHLNAEITNLSNWDLGSNNPAKTSLKASAKFLGESKLNFDMEFNVSDSEDKFNFSGNLAGISAGEMNSFLKPALNIEVQGKISSMYFNFFGNNNEALGDTRLQYHDFKVEVLKKDGFSKNKILSGLANLFLKNKVANKKMDQKNISTTRDKTKSFWNFLWLCIKNGALKSFI